MYTMETRLYDDALPVIVVSKGRCNHDVLYVSFTKYHDQSGNYVNYELNFCRTRHMTNDLAVNPHFHHT